MVRQKMIMLVLCATIPGFCAFFGGGRIPALTRDSAPASGWAGTEIPQSTIDIGTVWSAAQGIHRDFLIRNTSGRAITIQSVESDCGCTAAKAGSSEIPSGQSTKIAVDFWPPAVANDRGGAFQRNISVTLVTNTGIQTVTLTLTGFLAPDASLRILPQIVEVVGSLPVSQPAATLHLKGSVHILASIPDSLFVTAGSSQRVLVEKPQINRGEAVGTKDVKLFVAKADMLHGCGNWDASMTFAPDASSEGLTIHVRGHTAPPMVASPQSLILTDDGTEQAGTIKLVATETDGFTIETKSDLPLLFDVTPIASSNDRAYWLRVRLRGSMTADAIGKIDVTLNRRSSSSKNESISIPVVILHHQQSIPQTTAPTKSSSPKGGLS